MEQPISLDGGTPNLSVDCGNKNPVVLEFDHVRDKKTDNVSSICCSAYSLKHLKKEMEKCEIRCANCHRIVTHERRVRGSNGLRLLSSKQANVGSTPTGHTNLSTSNGK